MEMGQVLHIRCRQCGDQLKDRSWAYCHPCNLQLFYKAMPILLGMLLCSPLGKITTGAEVEFYQTEPKWPIYEHARYILD